MQKALTYTQRFRPASTSAVAVSASMILVATSSPGRTGGEQLARHPNGRDAVTKKLRRRGQRVGVAEVEERPEGGRLATPHPEEKVGQDW